MIRFLKLHCVNACAHRGHVSGETHRASMRCVHVNGNMAIGASIRMFGCSGFCDRESNSRMNMVKWKVSSCVAQVSTKKFKCFLESDNIRSLNFTFVTSFFDGGCVERNFGGEVGRDAGG